MQSATDQGKEKEDEVQDPPPPPPPPKRARKTTTKATPTPKKTTPAAKQVLQNKEKLSATAKYNNYERVPGEILETSKDHHYYDSVTLKLDANDMQDSLVITRGSKIKVHEVEDIQIVAGITKPKISGKWYTLYTYSKKDPAIKEHFLQNLTTYYETTEDPQELAPAEVWWKEVLETKIPKKEKETPAKPKKVVAKKEPSATSSSSTPKATSDINNKLELMECKIDRVISDVADLKHSFSTMVTNLINKFETLVEKNQEYTLNALKVVKN